jgi:hypothetical protein
MNQINCIIIITIICHLVFTSIEELAKINVILNIKSSLKLQITREIVTIN